VLDLGCGRGPTLAALARRLDEGARLIGLDLRQPQLTEPLAADPRVETLVADLNAPLPLPDGSADAAVCFNVLECLTRKDDFLSEVARVLVAGGHLLLGHADFDTIVFNTSDLALTRQIVHAFADTTASWMETSDGTMGRKLLELARRSSFEVIQTLAWVGVHTDFSDGGPARTAVRAMVESAGQHPGLAGRIDGWVADLEALDRRGAFLYSINDYAVLLRKPTV
jgi:SAM-dependent methyltransferase